MMVLIYVLYGFEVRRKETYGIATIRWQGSGRSRRAFILLGDKRNTR